MFQKNLFLAKLKEKDLTQEDAAKIIANDIALRLGAYFHKEMYNKDSYGDL